MQRNVTIFIFLCLLIRFSLPAATAFPYQDKIYCLPDTSVEDLNKENEVIKEVIESGKTPDKEKIKYLKYFIFSLSGVLPDSITSLITSFSLFKSSTEVSGRQ